MTALFQNFIGGEITLDLDNVETTVQSTALAALITVAGPDTMTMILDPDGIAGPPEVVTITAHTAGDVAATVIRGVEGTTARAHKAGMEWVHGFTQAWANSIEARLAALETP